MISFVFKQKWLPGILIGLATLSMFLLRTLDFSGNSIPSSYPDGYVFTWNFWWAKYAQTRHISYLYSPKIFHPYGANLLLHTFVPALTTPLVSLFPNLTPAALFNIAILICFILNFACAYIYLFIYSQNWMLSCVLAILLTLHPFFIAHLDGGHLNLLAFFPLILVIGSTLVMSADSKNKLRDQLVIIMGMQACLLLNLYYFYYGLIFLALTFILRSLKRAARPLFIPIAITLLLSAIPLWEIGLLVFSKSYTPDHSPIKHSADLLSFIVPGRYQFISQLTDRFQLLSGVIVNSAEAGIYVGWTILIVMLLIFVKQRRSLDSVDAVLIGGIFTFIILSLGPVLQAGGTQILSPLPYRWINKIAPIFPSVPVRFAIVAIFCMFVLIAKNYQQIKNKKLLYILLLLCVLEYLPLPLHSNILSKSPVLTNISKNSLVYALHDTDPLPERRMYNQTIHGKNITEAFLARRPIESLDAYKSNRFLRYLIEGGEVSPKDLQLEWQKLAIKGVLVGAGQKDILENIKKIPWLPRVYSDQEFAFFLAY